MKNIIKFFTILLAGTLLFVSCGEREYDFKEYDPSAPKSGKVFLSLTSRTFMFEGTDDEGEPMDEDIYLYVRVLGPPPATDVTVNFEVIDSSTVIQGTHYELDSESFVIPAGKAYAALKVTLLEAAFPLADEFKMYFKLTGSSSDAYTLHDVNVFATYTLIKDCALSLDVFDGAFNVDYQFGSDSWPATVSPLVSVSQIKIMAIWLDVDSLFLKVNPDATLTDPFIGSADDYEGQYIGLYDATYGRVRFEDITDGKILNKCTGEFEFKATPTLPDSGYWWGGAKHFRLVPTAKGMKLEVYDHKGTSLTPVKRN